MKTALNFKKSLIGTVLMAIVMSVSLSAEAVLYSRATVSIGNVGNGAGGARPVSGEESFFGNPVDTGLYDRCFNGINSSGNQDLACYGANSFSQASYESLKVYSYHYLYNPIAPNDFNELYYNDGALGSNEEGMPNWYFTSAMAYFSETIGILPSDDISYIRLKLWLDGEIYFSGNTFSGIWLGQYSGNPPPVFPNRVPAYIFHSSEQRYFKQEIWSDPIPVANNHASFGISLNSLVSDIIMQGDGDGGIHYGESNFSHTLKVASIAGFNAAGHQVKLTSAVGESGTQYAVADADPGTSIPEPASLALLGIGLIGMGWVRRWA